VRADRRLTVRETAGKLGISSGSCLALLTNNFVMQSVSAKSVPRLLTAEQKHCLSVASNLLECAEAHQNFFKNTATGNEIWIYNYNPKTKYEYASKVETVNQHFYLEVLRHSHDAVHHKPPRKWQSGAWQLHHNNASAYLAQLVQNFFGKHHIPQVCQPPYSSHMAPCDFFLFP
jgi:hypothetical protein